ncbi:MAG TPA: hypothetical protein VNO70_19690 [Blastocatellia bacterium]|nr:hypothetical protein [Blastocatellia bacterium]
MNCPVCGAQSTFGLNYCKRCGSNLIGIAQPVQSFVPVVRQTGAAWAIAFAVSVITLAGLGIVFTHVFDLVRPSEAGPPAREVVGVAMAMLVFGSLTVFGIVFMLIRLFSHIMGVGQEKGQQVQSTRLPLDSYPQKQIDAPPAAAPSVTEHTTRNFDPINSIAPEPPRRFNRQ